MHLKLQTYNTHRSACGFHINESNMTHSKLYSYNKHEMQVGFLHLGLMPVGSTLKLLTQQCENRGSNPVVAES